MKISQLSTDQIRAQMDARKAYSHEHLTWLHKDKRWMGLMNEYEKRVMNR